MINRTIILLGCLLGTLLTSAAAADLPEELAAALEAIERKGGTVRLDAKRDQRPPIEINLDGARDGNRVLEQVKLFPTVEIVRMDGSQVNDKGILEHLPVMINLRSLSLGGDRFSDAGLKSLKQLTRLETLHLGARITDVGLAEIRHLKRLRRLYLSGTAVTDEGLEHLKGMPHLETLMLAGTNVTDAGTILLTRHPRLKTLSLSFTSISNSGLQTIKELKYMRRLFLTGSQVTDQGAANLKRALPRLKIVR